MKSHQKLLSEDITSILLASYLLLNRLLSKLLDSAIDIKYQRMTGDPLNYEDFEIYFNTARATR